MTRPRLDVLYNERLVAHIDDLGMGVCRITYTPDAVNDPTAALSVRLPPRREAYNAVDGTAAFLDGVLPEGWVRDQLAERARLPAADTFGLLARYGSDCAGALVFVDSAGSTEDGGIRWMSEAELDDLVRTLRTAPFGVSLDAGIRISLGGVQEKFVAVVGDDGTIGIPLGGVPSTHIFKPTQLEPDGSERFPGIVGVEHFCMTAARRAAEHANDRVRGVSFTAPTTAVVQLAGRPVLRVERYDRTIRSGSFTRIHQEDGCQVLGLSPGDKYQRLPKQQPSFAAFADAVRRYGTEPLQDLRALLQQVVFSVCAGNADLHAKNLSLLHVDGVRVAPAYDVVSTAGFIGVNQELGLRIGNEYHLDDVTRDALLDEAAGWRLGRRGAGSAITAVCDALDEIIDDVRDELADQGIEHERVEQTHARFRHVIRKLSG